MATGSPAPSIVEGISQACCYSRFLHEAREVGVGTSFLYRYGGEDFIVTAWHCISGRRNDNLQLLRGSAGTLRDVPTAIELAIPFATEPDAKQLHSTFTVEVRLELYPESSERKPVWFVHPNLKQRVDVAAIPMSRLVSTGAMVQFMPDKWVAAPSVWNRMAESDDYVDLAKDIPFRIRYRRLNDDMRDGFYSRPGDDCFVLGYPFGLQPTGAFPIWKRASIATEPSLPAYGVPMVLIDTATRQGMSGGPVIQRQHCGTARLPKGTLSLVSGEVTKFIGVYTGRVDDDLVSAQLGRVWTREAVDAVCSGKQSGEPSDQMVPWGAR